MFLLLIHIETLDALHKFLTMANCTPEYYDFIMGRTKHKEQITEKFVLHATISTIYRWAEQNSYNQEYKEEAHQDWWEVQRHKTGWSQTHMWWLKTRRDILAVEVSPPPPKARSYSPTKGPGLDYLAGKKSPHNFRLWKSVGIVFAMTGLL